MNKNREPYALHIRVTAVIPTLNRPEDLSNAVKSILRQSRLPDELVIIDQSTGTDSEVLIKGLFENDGDEDELIKLIYVRDRSISGLVHAKKAAVAVGSGDIMMFLEDDVILSTDYIFNMIQGFFDHPEMLGSCGIITNVKSYSRLRLALFNLFHRGIFFDRRVSVNYGPKRWSGQMIQSTYLSGGVSAFRRCVFESVKFDTKNGFFEREDVDFSFRAVRLFGKEKFFINTSARLEHLKSEVNRDKFSSNRERKVRETICFYKKHRDQKWALANLLWLLIYLSMESIFVSIRSRHFGILIGYLKGATKGLCWRIRSF